MHDGVSPGLSLLPSAIPYESYVASGSVLSSVCVLESLFVRRVPSLDVGRQCRFRNTVLPLRQSKDDLPG